MDFDTVLDGRTFIETDVVLRRNAPQQMTDNLPNYTAMDPLAGKDPEEFTTHERRALL